MHALQVLGGQLNRREGILDFVRHLPGHFRPRLELIHARQFSPLRGEHLRHRVEVIHQAAQFVGRVGSQPLVEPAGRNQPRRA